MISDTIEYAQIAKKFYLAKAHSPIRGILLQHFKPWVDIFASYMVREIFQPFLVMSQQNRVFSSVSLEKFFQFFLRKSMDIDIAKTEGFKAWREIGGGKVAVQGGSISFHRYYITNR